MSARTTLSADGRTLTVDIPFVLRKRGGRKLVITPDHAKPWIRERRPDNALIKALSRAFRWRKLLEAGAYETLDELASAERLNRSYVCRVYRLSLLAPDLVEAILDGNQPSLLKLEDMRGEMPAEWERQRAKVSGT